jgi:hypothetical protein
MNEAPKPGSWWHTLPGTITAVATLLTAITGLLVGLSQLGFFKSNEDKPVDTVQESEAGRGTERSFSAASDAKASGLIIGDVRTRTTAIHGIDAPLRVALGTTYQIALDANEESYFRFRAPGDVKAIVDMQLDKQLHSNLQSRVFLLDADAAPVGDPVIYMNEIGNSHRAVAVLRLTSGADAGLRVVNGNKLADFWVTLLPAASDHFVPLMGAVVPRALKPGASTTGSLAVHEATYFALALAAGKYKVVLDFANVERKHTNLQGQLALLDADGGGHRVVLTLNEIDVSYRKTETFTVTRPRTVILRLYNDSHPVSFALRVVPEDVQ